MTFISYAQNFEDVILWRALKHVEDGFYIDIGAQDPIVDSVSNAFYEHGWEGVSVEPTEKYAECIRRARPKEFVEQAAVGKKNGQLVFYEFPETGLSTADSKVAERHKAAGFEFVEKNVSILSLDDIFNKYGDRDIHWLKIDVEGWEKNVLESWRYSLARPWILLVEATAPLTQELTHDQWEYLIFSKGYNFSYFDGLNRFYVHAEHQDLVEKIKVPPNVFDAFYLNGTSTHSFSQLVADRAKIAGDASQQLNEQRANAAEARVQEYEQRANAAEARVQEYEQRANAAEARAQEYEQRANAAEARAQEYEQRANAAEALAQVQKKRIDELGGNSHHWWLQACALEAERNNLRQSASWRVSAPLRLMAELVMRPAHTVRSFANHILHGTINALQIPLSRLMASVLRRPQLSNHINQWLFRYPALYQQLLSVARRGGVVQSAPAYALQGAEVSGDVAPELTGLTPYARKIYAELKIAIQKNKRAD